ncbi:MAG: hypothetical protein K0R54_950 [Clostridiaceae bacterium]|jgi:hypothetical protein|nr:hypothetical protein [Clostridiaceae bacterium]
MFDGMTTLEILKLLMPLLVIEGLLKIFCLYRLYKDEVKYFTKVIWIFTILFINTIGPLAYLLLGRKRD